MSKVTQMEAIKKIMDGQLKEAQEDMIKWRTRADEVEKNLNVERNTFEERLKKALKD